MRSRRHKAGMIGVVLCAYLVVLQAITGGVAMAGHAAAMADPFGARCADGVSDAQDLLPDERSDAACCALACGPAAVAAPFAPTASTFRYDPRPSPVRTASDDEAPLKARASGRARSPRGPPRIG